MIDIDRLKSLLKQKIFPPTHTYCIKGGISSFSKFQEISSQSKKWFTILFALTERGISRTPVYP